jgi:hypothetical protein
MLTTVEKAITERIVSTALNAGLRVGAYADDSADIEPTNKLADILEGAFSYDCVDLILESETGGSVLYPSITLMTGWTSLATIPQV